MTGALRLKCVQLGRSSLQGCLEGKMEEKTVRGQHGFLVLPGEMCKDGGCKPPSRICGGHGLLCDSRMTFVRETAQ